MRRCIPDIHSPVGGGAGIELKLDRPENGARARKAMANVTLPASAAISSTPRFTTEWRRCWAKKRAITLPADIMWPRALRTPWRRPSSPTKSPAGMPLSTSASSPGHLAPVYLAQLAAALGRTKTDAFKATGLTLAVNMGTKIVKEFVHFRHHQ
jgi:hypothetical protein